MPEVMPHRGMAGRREGQRQAGGEMLDEQVNLKMRMMGHFCKHSLWLLRLSLRLFCKLQVRITGTCSIQFLSVLDCFPKDEKLICFYLSFSPYS